MRSRSSSRQHHRLAGDVIDALLPRREHGHAGVHAVQQDRVAVVLLLEEAEISVLHACAGEIRDGIRPARRCARDPPEGAAIDDSIGEQKVESQPRRIGRVDGSLAVVPVPLDHVLQGDRVGVLVVGPSVPRVARISNTGANGLLAIVMRAEAASSRPLGPQCRRAFHAALAHGGMIGPEATLANEARSQADLDRANVRQFLNRATVKDKLQALGVGALNAQERADALSRGVPRRVAIRRIHACFA
jgi:hypothetical protein